MTKESDRLIALHGIAQWIKQRHVHTEYVAGMWKEHLLNQLLWMTYQNLQKRRPTAYRALSWSWASVIAKVSFRDILEAEEQESMARVLDVGVHTIKGKEGQVTGGYLKMKGKALAGTWKYWQTVPKTREDEEANPWDDRWSANPSHSFSFNADDIGGMICGIPDVEDDGFRGGETLCLAIQKRVKPEKHSSDKSWSLTLEGLVLIRNGSETFRRIGCFIAYSDGARYFVGQATEMVVEII